MVVFDPGVQHRIMVCVTPQKSCERLIEKGAARAREMDGQFVVIYVNNKQDLNRELKEHKIITRIVRISQKFRRNRFYTVRRKGL
jgi:K+-sensing histidine kinase KdpD